MSITAGMAGLSLLATKGQAWPDCLCRSLNDAIEVKHISAVPFRQQTVSDRWAGGVSMRCPARNDNELLPSNFNTTYYISRPLLVNLNLKKLDTKKNSGEVYLCL